VIASVAGHRIAGDPVKIGQPSSRSMVNAITATCSRKIS